tara:strand:- start:352 stop:615 length:264 start_codon:yes stop_codon:yes gene_type:complete
MLQNIKNKYQAVNHQVSTVMQAITLGVGILIGVIVFSQVSTSLTAPTGDLGTAFNDTITTFASAINLAIILLIIGVAIVLMDYVRNL